MFYEKGTSPIFQRLDCSRLKGSRKIRSNKFSCLFNSVLRKLSKINRSQDALSRWVALLRSPPCISHVDKPFPSTHLSSVNVDGIEVGCHQGPQHEEEANEASTKGKAQEAMQGGVRGLPRLPPTTRNLGDLLLSRPNILKPTSSQFHLRGPLRPDPSEEHMLWNGAATERYTLILQDP